MMGLVAATACGHAVRTEPAPDAEAPRTDLPTPAERSRYTRAPDYDDIRRFVNLLGRRYGNLDSLGNRDAAHTGPALFDLFTTGMSTDGRPIPIVVCARPMASSASDAHRRNRPVVLVVAGADASDVDGPSATLTVVRDLLLAANSGPSLIDSIVLVAIPVANPDGAALRMPTRTARADLNGPDSVGARLNANGVDLTRDIIAASAPESRLILSVLRSWDPDVVIELRTSAGGLIGYDVTLAPPRNPAALLTGRYARDSLFATLVDTLASRGLPTTASGRLVPELTPGPTVTAHVWDATDDRLTSLTEYAAVRNRLSLRIDAYARAPFARRVAATTIALDEALAIVASRALSIRSLTTTADTTIEHWGANSDEAPNIPIASHADSIGHGGTILVADAVSPIDSVRALYVSILDRDTTTATTRLPFSYVLTANDSALVNLLAQHNIAVTRLTSDRDAEIVERFLPDSTARAAAAGTPNAPTRPVAGHWLREITPTKAATLPAGSYLVSTAQPLGLLAALLLEPLSADGLAALGVIKPVSPTAPYPVSRLIY
jgi:dipeptidyl-peptidase 4